MSTFFNFFFFNFLKDKFFFLSYLKKNLYPFFDIFLGSFSFRENKPPILSLCKGKN